jgi:tetratricopeptide (TPR) repeat protein
MLVIVVNANVQDELEYARQLFTERQFDEAYLQIHNIIAEYPNTTESFDARILLSEIHIERRLYHEARLQLFMLLRNPFRMTFEQRARVYYNLSLAFFYDGNYPQAIESFERLFIDFRNTSEGQRAIPLYFDCFFNLRNYQTVITKSREMLPLYRDPEIQAELLFQQARAYFIGNMLDQATRTIQDIRNRFSQTMAAWKAIELQIMILERERGKQAAIDMLVTTLEQPIARNIEENLSWLLFQYYIDLGQNLMARETINNIINRFTMSENISKYHLAWLEFMYNERNIRAILDREESILSVAYNKEEYHAIVLYFARTHVMAQDFWTARDYLDRNISESMSDIHWFDYHLLYAEILTFQGQFERSIEILNSILNTHGHLGRNYEALIKLGDIHFLHYNLEAIALNFYRQAFNLARGIEQTSYSLQMIALCLEALGQYSESLHTLTQIPLDRISDPRQRFTITNKITLLQIFYHSDTQQALTKYLQKNITKGGNLSLIDQTTLLAIELKKFDEALSLLQNQPNDETRIEMIKLYFLFAYKGILVNNFPEADRNLALARTETNRLGANISVEDRFMINSFNDFLTNRGALSRNIIDTVVSYVNSPVANENAINFRNFFRLQLWRHYRDNNMTDEMFQIAHSIRQDAFVGELDFQRINVLLASRYFEDGMYSQAISHFNQANRFLTFAYAEYYYQYAMSLYESGSTQRGLEILQKLVLNNTGNELLNEARNLIVSTWIRERRYQDALDILNQIPPLRRTNQDYRYFAMIFRAIDDNQREKDAILMINDRSVEELLRIAMLHFLTGDVVMADYTLRDILERTTEPIHRMNAFAVLGNISYNASNFTDAINQFEEFFKLHNRNTNDDDLVIPAAQVAKELIISYYSTNNRPRAETTQRNVSNVIGRNSEIQAEIRLHEGIYYARMDRARAVRPLTQVIEDLSTPTEMAFTAMYWRGVVHVQDRRFEQARNDFLSAMNTKDDRLKNQVALSLGNLLLNQGQLIDAMEYYYLVILNDREGTFARDAAHNYALAGKNLQVWDQVIAAYQIIMERWGATHLSSETMVTIGFSYFQAREYSQALNILNHLINSGEIRDMELLAETHYWIAETKAAQGDFAGAAVAYREIRTRFSRATRWADLAHLRLGMMYMEMGESENGLRIFRELVRIHGAASDIGREANRFLQ